MKSKRNLVELTTPGRASVRLGTVKTIEGNLAYVVPVGSNAGFFMSMAVPAEAGDVVGFRQMGARKVIVWVDVGQRRWSAARLVSKRVSDTSNWNPQLVGPYPGDALALTSDAVTLTLPAAGWYSVSNVLWAYQPLGAASLSASYVNLADPGTYDCTVPSGCVAPAFDAATGWYFHQTASIPGLSTGLTTSGKKTVLVRAYQTTNTKNANEWLLASVSATACLGYEINAGYFDNPISMAHFTKNWMDNSQSVAVTPYTILQYTGVYAFSGTRRYFFGTTDGSTRAEYLGDVTGSALSRDPETMLIGFTDYNPVVPDLKFGSYYTYIQAAICIDDELTDQEVEDLADVMLGLTA